MARTPIPMTADVVHKMVRRHAAGIMMDLFVWKRRVSTIPAQAGPHTLVGGHKLTRTQAENNTTTEIQAQRFGQIQPKVDSSTFKELAVRPSAVKTQHPLKPCPTAHVSILDADAFNANPPFFLRIVLWIAPFRPSPSFWIR